jgi:uncharacterized surface protein with fasciclin (FAS1) repeats
MKNFSLWLAAGVASALVGCGDSSHEPAQASVVATAQATPSLTTLVQVVQFASINNDLVDLLSNPNSLTVFAPTNGAFDSLAVELTGAPGAKAADLLTPGNKSLLRTVLQYHVLSTKVNASAIPFGRAITPVSGGIFKIDNGAPPVVNDGRNRKSRITSTDIAATNGVVHVVDTVLLPSDKTIVATAIASAPEFTSLVAALQFASNGNDLVDLLSGVGPFTVFAPTNLAFDALAVELTGNANKELVRKVLQYHVLSSRVLKAEVPVDQAIATALGQSFKVSSAFEITDAKNRRSTITGTDVLNTNGVIHVINQVLLPN